MAHLRPRKPMYLLLLSVLTVFVLALACGGGATSTSVAPTEVGPTGVAPTGTPAPTVTGGPTATGPTGTSPAPTATIDPRIEAAQGFLDIWNAVCADQGFEPCPLTVDDLPEFEDPVTPEEAQQQFIDGWNRSCAERGFEPCPLTEDDLSS